MRVVTVENVTRNIAIGDRIRVADTSPTRLFGLLGRRGLQAGEGLWIEPSSGVHTFGMMFRIDVLGLDKHLRVTKIWQQLAPFRVTSVNLKIRSVIELQAGTVDTFQVQLGDQLRIVG